MFEVKIVDDDTLHVVESTLELAQNLVGQVAVTRGVVLQIQRVKDHKVLL